MKVTRYAIRLNGGNTGDGHNKTGQIHLFNDSNKWVGTLDFFNENIGELPEDQSRDGKIILSFHDRLMLNLVDLLRNESPVYIEWNEHTRQGFISSSQEPVGANDEDHR